MDVDETMCDLCCSDSGFGSELRSSGSLSGVDGSVEMSEGSALPSPAG